MTGHIWGASCTCYVSLNRTSILFPFYLWFYRLVEKSLGRFVDERKAKTLKDRSLPLEGYAVVAGRTDKGVTALQQVCSFCMLKNLFCHSVMSSHFLHYHLPLIWGIKIIMVFLLFVKDYYFLLSWSIGTPLFRKKVMNKARKGRRRRNDWTNTIFQSFNEFKFLI